MDTYNGRDSFKALCDACRTGNAQQAMAMINEGVNIHALDEYDYSPLVIVSWPMTHNGESLANRF